MRYENGIAFYTVTEVATAVGVSSQTVRDWERQGYFASQRSPGGHRMYTEETLAEIRDRAVQRRRQRVVEAGPGRDLKHPDSVNWDWAATGARLRAAREDRQQSQAQVAAAAGISRALLSSIERGVAGASMNVFSRLAEVLGLPMAHLAPMRVAGQAVMRFQDRPETVLGGGVTWQELAAPGYSIAPAVVFVEPGSDSGGYLTAVRENFVLVTEGSLEFRLTGPDEKVSLSAGDSLMLAAGRSHSWRNSDERVSAQALWVELLAPMGTSASGPPAP